MKLLVILLFLSFIKLHAGAPLMPFYSARAMGMGGAYSAIVDNSDSLFFNPAGLAKMGGVAWEILDPGFGIGNTGGLGKLSNLTDPTSFASTLNSLYGTPLWFGTSGKSAFSFSSFAVAGYGKVDLDINVTSPAFPSLEVGYVTDTGVVMGVGFPIIPKFLYSGIALRKTYRVGGRGTYAGTILTDLDLTPITDDLASTGNGYGLDLGFNIVTPTPFVSPTFSLVWRNVGGVTYNGSAPPPGDDQDVTLGAAVEFDIGITSITPTFEINRLLNYDEQLFTKINMGVEISIPLIDIRAGFHQGYYTGGLGISLGFVDIDLATYGVELGTYPGQKEDRRYLVQFSFGIGLDSDLGGVFGSDDSASGGADGKGTSRSSARRRGLKQRR